MTILVLFKMTKQSGKSVSRDIIHREILCIIKAVTDSSLSNTECTEFFKVMLQKTIFFNFKIAPSIVLI